jgi:uncharacterized protein (TIGR03083 family)
MDSQRLRDCLEADFRRLRDVTESADPGAEVPSCPGWTMTDLVRHVGAVYLDKVECMRLGRDPGSWPPPGLDQEPLLALLDRGYAALAGEFATRRPEDRVFTWYEPDQSVAFWIRRMAQETVIHRVDAELAAGGPVTGIPGDLAADGIDELLVTFVEYGTTNWPEEFAEMLKPAGDRLVSVVTPERSWLLRLTSRDVRVVDESAADGPAAVGSPAAAVAGPAADVLLWLWSRGGEGTAATGDEDTIALLRRVLAASTQ